MIKNGKVKNEFLLLLTALIWGIAFVAQSKGGDAVGPYSFNMVRSIIGGIVLIPAIAFLDYKGLCHRAKTSAEKKTLLLGGALCGILLCIASNLQQVGINSGVSAGKAGFLTACYVVFVPILGIVINKKCGINVWISVVITLIGLYLLCINEEFKIAKEDLLVIICALVFAVHILVIDYFSPKVDGVRMSCIQFLVCGLLSGIPMAINEMGIGNGAELILNVQTWANQFTSMDAWIPILYAGVCSCGIAYTLQIVGQQGVNPTVASILLSLESVFSVIAGLIILHEIMSVKSIIGCVLIFSAVILAQIPYKVSVNK